jgi:membrane-associated phospholipid phosphatase
MRPIPGPAALLGLLDGTILGIGWQRRGSGMTTQRRGLARVWADLVLPRHAGDAVRLVAATAIFLLAVELVDRDRVHVLEIDAFRLVNDLPAVLYPLVWAVMQLGNVLAVPVLAGVAALTRRYRLAVNLAVAGFGCWALARLVKDLVNRGRPAQYLPDVNFHGPPATGLGFISGHAAVAVALASVASPYLSRPARRVAWALAAAVCLSRLYVGAHLPLDVIGGAAVGWAAGAAVHLLLGAPGGRPSPDRVRRALAKSGLQPVEVVALGLPDAPRSARFLATTATGQRLFVKFVPRERRNWDLAYRTWQRVARRARVDPGRFGSPSEQVEREAYMALLAGAAGVRVPRVVLARPTGNGAGLLVMEWVPGRSLGELPPDQVDDGLLADLWGQVGRLCAARIAHHDLGRHSVLVDEQGRCLLVDFDASEALAGDPALALDVAELLVSLARMVGAERALAAARAVIGSQVVRTALEPARPRGLTALGRDDLRADPGLWDDLRRGAAAGPPPRPRPGPSPAGPPSSSPSSSSPSPPSSPSAPAWPSPPSAPAARGTARDKR